MHIVRRALSRSLDGAKLTARHVIVAGIGNDYRQDDGVGPRVAREVARAAPGVVDVGPLGEPLDLLGAWDGADLAVIIDAVRSGGEPGTVSVVEFDHNGKSARPQTATVGTTSTHGIGIAGAVRIAQVLGTAPRRIVVVAIEAGDLGQGAQLTPEVEHAVPIATRRVIELVESFD